MFLVELGMNVKNNITETVKIDMLEIGSKIGDITKKIHRAEKKNKIF